MGRDSDWSHFDSLDEQMCVQEWLLFSERPGLHLRWIRTKRKVSEITRDSQTLARVEGLSLFPFWGCHPRPPRRITIDAITYRVGGRIFNANVTGSDGQTLVSFTGTKNYDREARAVAHMSDGRSLRFPVHGTSKSNAIMTAVDERGQPVFALRQVRGARSQPNCVEIVVEANRHLTPELLLVMATSYYNLYTFFDRGGGG
jgi:hypothetical protein